MSLMNRLLARLINRRRGWSLAASCYFVAHEAITNASERLDLDTDSETFRNAVDEMADRMLDAALTATDDADVVIEREVMR